MSIAIATKYFPTIAILLIALSLLSMAGERVGSSLAIKNPPSTKVCFSRKVTHSLGLYTLDRSLGK